jgi:hypothetical protein
MAELVEEAPALVACCTNEARRVWVVLRKWRPGRAKPVRQPSRANSDATSTESPGGCGPILPSRRIRVRSSPASSRRWWMMVRLAVLTIR